MIQSKVKRPNHRSWCWCADCPGARLQEGERCIECTEAECSDAKCVVQTRQKNDDLAFFLSGKLFFA